MIVSFLLTSASKTKTVGHLLDIHIFIIVHEELSGSILVPAHGLVGVILIGSGNSFLVHGILRIDGFIIF